MRKKPIKWGIKMLWRADSINGYLSDFEICTGKCEDGVTRDSGFSVVTKLCSGLHGKRHEVYFDNCFTSLKLLQTLFRNRTHSCGTLKSGKRNFPKEMFDKKANNKLERGTCIFRRKGPITTVSWIDKKPVNVFPHQRLFMEKQQSQWRREKDGGQQFLPLFTNKIKPHLSQLLTYY